MAIYNPLPQLRHLLRLLLVLARLPKVRLQFHSCLGHAVVRAMHARFTRRHARYWLIKNKTMGIALIDLSKFKSPEDYLATVKRKDYAGHQARTARKRGYTVRSIDRNDHTEAIYAIHTSASSRQGRPMDASYQVMHSSYDDQAPMRCAGVFDADGRLTGYCRFGVYGNFAATDILIGVKNSDGAMFLLLLEVISTLIAQGGIDFFMYDTYLGARAGLQDFKRRAGFRPYRVSYLLC